jgi:hypothetical protein
MTWHSPIDGLVAADRALWTLVQAQQDALIVAALVAAAFGLWRVLYWPALRGERGRHRAR